MFSCAGLIADQCSAVSMENRIKLAYNNHLLDGNDGACCVDKSLVFKSSLKLKMEPFDDDSSGDDE